MHDHILMHMHMQACKREALCCCACLSSINKGASGGTPAQPLKSSASNLHTAARPCPPIHLAMVSRSSRPAETHARHQRFLRLPWLGLMIKSKVRVYRQSWLNVRTTEKLSMQYKVQTMSYL